MDPRAWFDDWWQRREPLVAPTQAGFYGFSVALLLFALVIGHYDFVPLLDHVNLAFHESGHVLFLVFGATLSLYGGTLMQFVFPALTTIHFAHRGQTLSAAACAAWFCENFRYTAIYMADARARVLPLVGGGEHDWFHIFGRWGVLHLDTRIAGITAFLCWAGLAGLWLLLWRRYRRADG